MNSTKNTLEVNGFPATESYIHLSGDESDDFIGSVTDFGSKRNSYGTGELLSIAKQIDNSYLDKNPYNNVDNRETLESRSLVTSSPIAATKLGLESNRNYRDMFSSQSTPLSKENLGKEGHGPSKVTLSKRAPHETSDKNLVPDVVKDDVDRKNYKGSRSESLYTLSRAELQELKDKIELLLDDDTSHSPSSLAPKKFIPMAHENLSLSSISDTDDRLSLCSKVITHKSVGYIPEDDLGAGISKNTTNGTNYAGHLVQDDNKVIKEELMKSTITTPQASSPLLRTNNGSPYDQERSSKSPKFVNKPSIPEVKYAEMNKSSNLNSVLDSEIVLEQNRKLLSRVSKLERRIEQLTKVDNVQKKEDIVVQQQRFPSTSEMEDEIEILKDKVETLTEEVQALRDQENTLANSTEDRASIHHGVIQNEKECLRSKLPITSESLSGDFKIYYQKLHLNEIDKLSKSEMSDLIKNIMLSLLITDLEHLPASIAKLGKFLKICCNFLDELHNEIYQNSTSGPGPSFYLKSYDYGIEEIEKCILGIRSRLEVCDNPRDLIV